MSATIDKRCLLGPFSQIITFQDIPVKGPVSDNRLHIISNGGIIVNNGIIEELGHFNDLRTGNANVPAEIMEEPMVLLPSMTDCHTHICFDGTRAVDYSLKLQGMSYVEIARQGGGIWQTVQDTRLASQDCLAEGILSRAETHLRQGVTTIEVKSGYGLSGPYELKMLRAIRAAAQGTRADLVPTFLGAHTVPRDFDGPAADYLHYLKAMVLPQIVKEQLSRRLDIFIEETAFTAAESEIYLKAGKDMGFDVTVHADQFTTGGSELAVKVGAISADHLEASGRAEIERLSKSQTLAVVLPGASLGLGLDFAPARQLLDAGCAVAIASDWNPGSAPMGDLLLQAAVLGMYQKLTAAETFAGLTYRAAAALGLHDRGRIQRGFKAHLMAFQTNDYREILYHQGSMKPLKVWC